MREDKTYPLWFLEVLQMTVAERKKLVEEILQAVSREGSPNDKPTKSGLELVRMLKNDCELQGFYPFSQYAKVQGPVKDLKDKFHHKWGYPTLLYKHKRMPICIAVNPAMRKDKMILTEIVGNGGNFDGVYVVGLTG